MKICILGNSHVACLKSAWDEDHVRYPGIALTFFASPMGGLVDLRRESDRLVALTERLRRDLAFTSGGAEFVDLAAYDVFLVMGLGFHTPKVDRKLSRAVQQALMQDLFEATLTGRLVRDIRSVSGAPIVIGANPLPASTGDDNVLDHLVHPEEVMRQLSLLYADGTVTFLPQPRETITRRGWRTKAVYASGAPRLAHVPKKVGAEFDDTRNRVHMNKDYGRIWLSHFLETLPLARAA